MASRDSPLMDINVISSEDETNSVYTNKDEQVTGTAHENGYESECSSSCRSDEEVARSALEVEADTFTRFIERQRTEVMFELRNIRLGERPVTGQPNRERIQTFLDSVREQQQQQTLTRTPAPRPAAPSAHIDDIDALTNRRCVSAALGSTGFRRDLENAIRRSIETRPATPVQSIPQAPPMPRTSSPVNTEQQTPPRVPLRTAPVTREQQRPQMAQPAVEVPFTIERQERELTAWQTITQLQQEIIVLEISDLVHRQLVTSALESDFRTHLEQNILTRLARGAPPLTEQEQQAQAAVPVIAAQHVPPMPAPTRRTATNNQTVTIGDLSTRLDAMEHMLKLMFTMQMDMQRSLRQEVSSALANNPITTMAAPTQPTNAGHCTVCLTAIADTVLYRCGHLCVCYMCGLNLRTQASSTGVKCPICRAPVDDILRVYRSSRDGEQNH